MDGTKHERDTRREVVERIFDEMGWENLEWVQEWDGAAIEDLREVLTEEQFQALLDQLQDQDLRTR